MTKTRDDEDEDDADVWRMLLVEHPRFMTREELAADMTSPTNPIRGALGRFATEHLALILGAVFIIDLMVPDMLPFVDEIVLGAATLLVARWQARRRDAEQAAESDAAKPPPKDVTPG